MSHDTQTVGTRIDTGGYPESVQVVGMDPGLVHTGLVCLDFDARTSVVSVAHQVIDGVAIDQIVATLAHWERPVRRVVFAEQYIPRQSLNTDVRMVKAEQQIKDAVPDVRLINNTGVRQVVKPGLLALVGAVGFPTTHHRDLQAAARIALYGMVKDHALNQLLVRVVKHRMEGTPWTIKK